MLESKLGSIRFIPKNQRNNSLYSRCSQNARSLRTEYRLISSDAFSKRSGGMDARPSLAYIASNVGDNSVNALSAKRLIVRSGWSCGIRVSKSMNASIVTCGSCSPRTSTTSARDASTLAGAGTSPEEPKQVKVGEFHQTANEASLGPPSASFGFDCEVQ